MAKIQDQDDRNEQVFAALDRANNLQPSWFELIRNLFMCRTRRERYVCYIMTIGVIDEVRKLGIGTNLLHAMTESVVFFQERAVEALYLHVVSYNHQALAFYAKNEFNRIADLKDWYNIQGKN